MAEARMALRKILQKTDTVDHASTELMHVQVANVGRPVLMAPLRLKWHRFFQAATLHRHLQVIELSIEREDTSTGTRGKVDAQLQQGRMDPVGSQFWVFLELLHLVHGSQIDLTAALLPGV